MQTAWELAHYLAEWYLPELTEQSVDEFVTKLDVAAKGLSDAGSPVRLHITLAVPTDEVLYGVFDAHSPEIVKMTCQRAGLPPQRLTAHIGARVRRQLHSTPG
jgi:hypothetical protein